MEDGLRAFIKYVISSKSVCVLILVLMEDGLRGVNKDLSLLIKLLQVLILVLMEDGLREKNKIMIGYKAFVLILVLMEDGLREGPCSKKRN